MFRPFLIHCYCGHCFWSGYIAPTVICHPSAWRTPTSVRDGLIGSWFVPILNLFRPSQIVKYIRNKSDPETVGVGDSYYDTRESQFYVEGMVGILARR